MSSLLRYSTTLAQPVKHANYLGLVGGVHAGGLLVHEAYGLALLVLDLVRRAQVGQGLHVLLLRLEFRL